MKLKPLKIFVAVLIFLAGLMGIGYMLLFGGTPKTPTFNPTQTNFSDQEILNAVYSDYKGPNGFFEDALIKKEEKNINSVRYEKWGINNTYWSFYCTNNFREAKKVVEEHIKIWSTMTITENNENEKFFQFKVIDNRNIPSSLLRVFKCSYIKGLKRVLSNDYQYRYHKETYYQRNKPGFTTTDYAGEFAQRPVTTDNVKELIEFLWFSGLGEYNIGGRKVLSSFTKDEGNSIAHIIYETQTSYGTYAYDEIILIKSVYTVNKNSGKIYLSQETIKSITGNYN